MFCAEPERLSRAFDRVRATEFMLGSSRQIWATGRAGFDHQLVDRLVANNYVTAGAARRRKILRDHRSGAGHPGNLSSRQPPASGCEPGMGGDWTRNWARLKLDFGEFR